MNIFTISGRMVRDAEVFGKVTKFTVAVDDYNPVSKQREGVFFPCVTFGSTGEAVVRLGGKGREVVVTGRMKENEWEDNTGQKRRKWEWLVSSIDFMGPQVKPATEREPSHRETGYANGGFTLDDD
jgi:single-strand DNA-binding protein